MMKKFGPLKYLSCIRYEAKHKVIKDNANVVRSRRKPAYTFALKHQLSLARRFLNEEGFSLRLSSGPLIDTKLTSLQDYGCFQKILPSHISNDCISTSWVKKDGMTYNLNAVMTVESKDNRFTFGVIKYVILFSDENFCFFYLKLNTVRLHRHYNAFEVELTNDWGLMYYSDLVLYSSTKLYRMGDAKYYIPCI